MEERKHVVDARVSEPGAMLSPQREMSRRRKRWHGVRLSAGPTTGNRLKEVVSIGKSVRECEHVYCARRMIDVNGIRFVLTNVNGRPECPNAVRSVGFDRVLFSFAIDNSYRPASVVLRGNMSDRQLPLSVTVSGKADCKATCLGDVRKRTIWIVGKLHVLLLFHVVERWLGSERWTRNASQGNEIDSKNRRANCHVSLQSRKGEKEGRAEWDN